MRSIAVLLCVALEVLGTGLRTPDIGPRCLVVVGVNTSPRRVVLALTVALGLFVGVWAWFFRRSFYDDFPGLGLHWVSLLGPYDEHLVSDTGSAYLALTSLSVAGIVSRRAGAGRLAGLGWTMFGVLHLGFHLTHLMGSIADRVGNVVSLGLSALLGVLLLVLPTGRAAPPARQRD